MSRGEYAGVSLFRRGGRDGEHSGGWTRSDRGRRNKTDFDSVDPQALNDQINTWVSEQRPKIGEILLDLGSVDPDELIEALQAQKASPQDDAAKAFLGQVLVQLGSIDEASLAAALAQQFGIPLADLTAVEIQQDALAKVPEEMARRHRVLPVRIEDGRVYIATADPLDTEAIRELAQTVGSLGLMIGSRGEIDRLLDEQYNVLHSAGEMIRGFELADVSGASAATVDDDGFQLDENAPIVQVVNRILTQGVRSRASDIHVEPEEHFVRVRYRVDGAMTEAIRLPGAMASAVVSRLKVMSGLNIVERRRPQDGQFAITVDQRPIDVRIATAATVHGEKVVMRLLDKTKSLISLKDLGMPPTIEMPYIDVVKAPLGMLLCTGPTGSGKTTTLYATLTEINDPTRNVVTIEDPVEYQFEGISQMPVSDSGMSFAEGLRGILRQDPDVILVGEIRDEETARIAMQASLTGHFVLSSLHSVDSVAAIHRFTDMGIEPFLVASALTGVVGQRLLRRMCSNCRTPYHPTPAEVAIVAEHVGHLPHAWLRGAGCNLCNHTGYRGRVGVYELLVISDGIRELIVERATHMAMRQQAIAEGMKTMQEQAFTLVVDGITTVEDVIRSVYAPGVDTIGEDSPKELGPGKRMLRDGPGQIDGGDGELEGGHAQASPTANGSPTPNGSPSSLPSPQVDEHVVPPPFNLTAPSAETGS